MNVPQAVDERHLLARLFQAAATRYRPALGWVALSAGLSLSLLPALAIRDAAWIDLRRVQVNLEWVSFFSLVSAWWLVGRLRRGTAASVLGPAARPVSSVSDSARPRLRFLSSRLAAFLTLLLWLSLGAITVSQVLVHWIPGPVDTWRAANLREFPSLAVGVQADLMGLQWRYKDWLQGVKEGGAYQDDFVFLSLFGILLWLLAGATALLAHTTRNGLIVGLPALWVLATFLFYGEQSRLLILVGFFTTLLLHVLLDQQRMESLWSSRGTDFSPMLLVDRLFSVGIATLVIALIASFFPNIVFGPVAYKIYRTMTPVYESVDSVTELMFPDLKGGRRGMGRLGSGLPNRFLLEGGTELGRYEVMRVSTSYPFGEVLERGDMPPRLYMRRGTFASYDGRGWNNSESRRDTRFPANRAWRSEEEWPGRTPLSQRVRLTAPTAVLPAAGEPAEFRVDYELDLRSDDDLVSVWSGEGPLDRFEVISYVPAVSAETLRNIPHWQESDAGLPPGIEAHLLLPESVTQRTRDLARHLAAGHSAPFAVAESIEAYLRGISYNLTVPAPPPGEDVADFFLFDLQEGYCDYYTTAFAVLARLNGLPTRFATGYIGGYWDFDAGEWTITEAEAHSWPEVYLPEIGWIPFEPTAGRPSLQRNVVARAAPHRTTESRQSQTEPAPGREPFDWNWQMLFWLLPLAGLLYALVRWLENRQQDPWLGILAWGSRVGRPYRAFETEREYGDGLSLHLAGRESEPERRRRLTRNIVGLTASVSLERYGPLAVRPGARQRGSGFWRAIRRDIRRLPW